MSHTHTHTHTQKNSYPPVFKDMFGGAFLDQKICRGCDHRFECEESFLSLSLPVKSKTLEESLKEFVKGDWLEGDNAYFCEKCNEKVCGGEEVVGSVREEGGREEGGGRGGGVGGGGRREGGREGEEKHKKQKE